MTATASPPQPRKGTRMGWVKAGTRPVTQARRAPAQVRPRARGPLPVPAPAKSQGPASGPAVTPRSACMRGRVRIPGPNDRGAVRSHLPGGRDGRAPPHGRGPGIRGRPRRRATRAPGPEEERTREKGNREPESPGYDESPWESRRTLPRAQRHHDKSGDVLLSHTLSGAVPSPCKALASGFGMGPGVSPWLWSPQIFNESPPPRGGGMWRSGNRTMDATDRSVTKRMLPIIGNKPKDAIRATPKNNMV